MLLLCVRVRYASKCPSMLNHRPPFSTNRRLLLLVKPTHALGPDLKQSIPRPGTEGVTVLVDAEAGHPVLVSLELERVVLSSSKAVPGEGVVVVVSRE